MAFVGTVCSHVQGGSISTVSTSSFGHGTNWSLTYLVKSLLELADFFHGVSYVKTCAYFAFLFGFF